MRKREDDVFPNPAGIDIRTSGHWLAGPRHLAEIACCDPVRRVGVLTPDLKALAPQLVGLGVDMGAVESATAYWIRVFEVLEQLGLKVCLVNARQLKYVLGSRSYLQDCQRLQRLMSLELLCAAWRPTTEVHALRVVMHQRESLLTSQAGWTQRMQKALVQLNIQFTEVLSDVVAIAGQAIGRNIEAGMRDSGQSARDHQRRLMSDWYETAGVLLGKLPRAGSAERLDKAVNQRLRNWAGMNLTSINGLRVNVVMRLLVDGIGPVGGCFGSFRRCCSSLGLYLGTKVNGGNVLSSGFESSESQALQAVGMAAQSLLRSKMVPGAFYRRLSSRMDTLKTNTAAAQVGKDCVLHAHHGRSLGRPRPAELRKAAAPAQRLRPKTQGRRHGLPAQ